MRSLNGLMNFNCTSQCNNSSQLQRCRYYSSHHAQRHRVHLSINLMTKCKTTCSFCWRAPFMGNPRTSYYNTILAQALNKINTHNIGNIDAKMIVRMNHLKIYLHFCLFGVFSCVLGQNRRQFCMSDTSEVQWSSQLCLCASLRPVKQLSWFLQDKIQFQKKYCGWLFLYLPAFHCASHHCWCPEILYWKVSFVYLFK